MIIGDEGPTQIGVVEPAPEGLAAAIQTTAGLLDQNVAIVTFPDRQAGEAALGDDKVAALLVVPADLSNAGA